jgi:hypothetical protein
MAHAFKIFVALRCHIKECSHSGRKIQIVEPINNSVIYVSIQNQPCQHSNRLSKQYIARDAAGANSIVLPPLHLFPVSVYVRLGIQIQVHSYSVRKDFEQLKQNSLMY